MDAEKYVVLRVRRLDEVRHSRSGSIPAKAKNSSFPTRSETPFIETEDLRPPEVSDLRDDPTVKGLAPALPVTLLLPTALSAVELPKEGGTAWGVEAVGATNTLWTGRGVTIAVLDTGIDEDHEAFAGIDCVQRDFTGEGTGDTNGHGTHCAGIAFGRQVAGYRFGIAPGVERVLIAKVLGSSGNGSSEDIFKAILWAQEHGANVISMSLGMDFPGYVDRLVKQGIPTLPATSRALEGYWANSRLFDKLADLIKTQNTFGKASLLVAASGNESQRYGNPSYQIAASPPANVDGIVAVGALERVMTGDNPFRVTNFSNTRVDIAAPGDEILSAAAGGGYAQLSGTSMAAPHVAGVAALWAEKLWMETGKLNVEELSAHLRSHALFLKEFDATDVGFGVVQAPIC